MGAAIVGLVARRRESSTVQAARIRDRPCLHAAGVNMIDPGLWESGSVPQPNCHSGDRERHSSAHIGRPIAFPCISSRNHELDECVRVLWRQWRALDGWGQCPYVNTIYVVPARRSPFLAVAIARPGARPFVTPARSQRVLEDPIGAIIYYSTLLAAVSARQTNHSPGQPYTKTLDFPPQQQRSLCPLGSRAAPSAAKEPVSVASRTAPSAQAMAPMSLALDQGRHHDHDSAERPRPVKAVRKICCIGAGYVVRRGSRVFACVQS